MYIATAMLCTELHSISLGDAPFSHVRFHVEREQQLASFAMPPFSCLVSATTRPHVIAMFARVWKCSIPEPEREAI